MTREELRVKWAMRRDEWQMLEALVNGSMICDLVLADLEALWRAEDEGVVNLTEGAKRSGYSADGLGRLLRTGVIPNLGRKGSPRIRIADLPRKPLKVERPPKTGRTYDPDTDARDLVSRRKGGANGL